MIDHSHDTPDSKPFRIPHISKEKEAARIIAAGIIDLQKLFREKPEARHAIELMLAVGERANEGKEGVIFKLTPADLSLAQRQELQQCGISFENERAMKILKISQQGKLRTEFERQLRAYHILMEACGSHAAQVPKPFLIGDIELPQKIQIKMGWRQTNSQEPVEIMIMEFIKGNDMATVLLQEALKRLNNSISDNQLAEMKFERLSSEVAAHLHFRIPGGKAISAHERLYEQRKIENENAERLIAFLSTQGFVLRPEIISQIKTAMQTLHKARLVHRDLHERNIMIVGPAHQEPTQESPQAFIIDFGQASEFQDETYSENGNYYEQDGMKFFSDESILRRLAPLTISKETKVRQQKNEELEKIMESVRTAWSAKEKVQRSDALKEMTDRCMHEGQEQTLERLYRIFSSSEEHLYKFIDVVIALLSSEALTPQVVSKFIENKCSEKKQPGKKMLALPVRFINILSRFQISYLDEKIK